MKIVNRRRFLTSALQVGAACMGAASSAGCMGRLVPPRSDDSTNTKPQGDSRKMASGDWDISVCGLNCAKCKVLARGECAGCRGPAVKNWSPDCEFRPCAQRRGHDYCFQCDEFPCDKLRAFANDGYEHHRLAVENLTSMRRMGLEAWIANQPQVMFCPGWLF
jgi:hypothetical protein